jgi:hypothetical protein
MGHWWTNYFESHWVQVRRHETAGRVVGMGLYRIGETGDKVSEIRLLGYVGQVLS